MTSAYQAVVVVVLATWFTLSILSQFNPGWIKRLRAHDYAKLLPQWRFFEKNAGQWDYHLLYRDRDLSGQVSRWTAIPLNQSRTAYGWFWNPHKRSVKVLADLASLISGSSLQTPQKARQSVPYLLVLHTVNQQKAENSSVVRQFMILWTSGETPNSRPQLLFRSVFQPLP